MYKWQEELVELALTQSMDSSSEILQHIQDYAFRHVPPWVGENRGDRPAPPLMVTGIMREVLGEGERWQTPVPHLTPIPKATTMEIMIMWAMKSPYKIVFSPCTKMRTLREATNSIGVFRGWGMEIHLQAEVGTRTGDILVREGIGGEEVGVVHPIHLGTISTREPIMASMRLHIGNNGIHLSGNNKKKT